MVARMHAPRAARALAALALALAALAAGCGPAAPPRFTVLTFNVLCSFCDTANYDPWADRLDAFDDVLARHAPDLFGLQELFTAAQVQEVADRVPGYGRVYFHDPAGQRLVDYPDATLFYRESLFELVESGAYWLSDTPDTAWSFGWANAQFWRLVAWARLRHKPSGRELYAATVHVDNNHPNQDRSAPLLLARTAAPAATLPVILMGDFNSDPSTSAYATLVGGVDGQGFKLQDAWSLAAQRELLHNQSSTPAYAPEERIDHVFLGGPSPWKVERWRVDLYRYGAQQRYPSDHFAISALLSL